MAFNIDQFKSIGLNNGGVRPSLFQVVMTGVPSQEVGFTDKFTFTCKASTIPASTIQQIEIPYFGRQIKLAGDRTFDNWNVTVMNDEDYIVRSSFEKWMNNINSHVSNLKSQSAYKINAQIYQYSKAGNNTQNIIRAYTFVGLFPVSVDAMTVDWGQTNQVQEFGVTFAYDYWLPSSPTFDNSSFNSGQLNTNALAGAVAGTSLTGNPQ